MKLQISTEKTQPSYRIERYSPDQHKGLGEKIDEMDEEILKAVKYYLHPMYSDEWDPQTVNETAEEYWSKLNQKSPVFLAFENPDDGLVGFINVSGDTGWRATASISAVSVSEKHRGTGVATDLLKTAMSWAKDQGYQYVIYNTQARNTPSRKFVEKMGFELFTVGYYREL